LVLIDCINSLREAFKDIQKNHPFKIEGVVILPDHLHCLWKLPEDTDDYSTRWRLINREFEFELSRLG
jgi:putative transposase